MELRLHSPDEQATDPNVLARKGRPAQHVPNSVADLQSLCRWLVDEHQATHILRWSHCRGDEDDEDEYCVWWKIRVQAKGDLPLPGDPIVHARATHKQEVSMEDDESLYTTAEAAFRLPYLNPSNVDTLYELLTISLGMKEQAYVPAVGLFQSSGWGKSRTVCELWQKDVWVVYCSFANAHGSGFPRKSCIADWFLQQCSKRLENSSALEGELACMTFCLAYFNAYMEVAEEVRAQGIAYRDFVTEMWKGGEPYSHRVQAQVENDLAKLMTAQAGSFKTGVSVNNTWSAWEEKSAHWLRHRGRRVSPDRLHYVFVFDEARHMVHKGFMEKNLFIPIRRSTRALRELGVCVLFMDTSPEISNFTPPYESDSSDRLNQGLFKIAPPIWGCFSADTSEESALLPCFTSNRFTDIACYIRAVQYGRPLWWAIFNASLFPVEQTPPPPPCEGLLNEAFRVSYDLARNKLLGGRGKWDNHIVNTNNLSSDAALSLLGPTVGINVDPRSNFASKLVANNLLTVVSVSACRDLVWTAWSPEPLVAMAATEAVRTLHRTKRYKELYDPLVEGLQAGWIDKGFEGELVTRIILLHAMEKAVDAKRVLHEKKLAGCCTVDEFCKHLVGQSFLALLDRKPTENEQKLAGARLHFNSFHKIYKKSSELEFGDVLMCIERQCAVICRANTWGDDIWLFAFLGSDDDELTEDNVAVVHVQAKEKMENDTKICLAKMSPEFSGLRIGSNLPYLSIYMNVMDTGKEAKGVSLVASSDIEEYIKCHAKAHRPIQEALEAERKAAGLPMDAKGHTERTTAAPMDVESQTEELQTEEKPVFPMDVEGQTRKKPAVEAWRKWFQAKRELQNVLVVKHLNGFNVDDGLKEILRQIVKASKDPFHTSTKDPFHKESLNVQKSKLSEDMFKLVNLQLYGQGV